MGLDTIGESISEYTSVVKNAVRRRFGMLFAREMARLRVDLAREIGAGVVRDDPSGDSGQPDLTAAFEDLDNIE